MKNTLSKLEILLTTTLLVTLIGFTYMAFFREPDAVNKLANVINQCNAIHEERLVNNCQPLTSKNWNILDHMDSVEINKIIKDNNLTIDTAQDRLRMRSNLSRG